MAYNGWGIYGLNGWDSYGLNGWDSYDKVLTVNNFVTSTCNTI